LLFDEVLVQATSEVFATMIFMEVVPGEPVTGKETIDSNITSMIGLAGDLRGMLAVHCPERVAKAITGSMLGMDVEELDDDVKDAIGEIANMVAGGLKESLVTDGKSTELAIPTTAVGKAIRLSGLANAERLLVPFTTEAGVFGIELKYVLS
jgi:chemotaxis protein CheX